MTAAVYIRICVLTVLCGLRAHAVPLLREQSRNPRSAAQTVDAGFANSAPQRESETFSLILPQQLKRGDKINIRGRVFGAFHISLRMKIFDGSGGYKMDVDNIAARIESHTELKEVNISTVVNKHRKQLHSKNKNAYDNLLDDDRYIGFTMEVLHREALLLNGWQMNFATIQLEEHRLENIGYVQMSGVRVESVELAFAVY